MICDLETGVCGVAGEEEMELIDLNPSKKKIELSYCPGYFRIYELKV